MIYRGSRVTQTVRGTHKMCVNVTSAPRVCAYRRKMQRNNAKGTTKTKHGNKQNATNINAAATCSSRVINECNNVLTCTNASTKYRMANDDRNMYNVNMYDVRGKIKHYVTDVVRKMSCQSKYRKHDTSSTRSVRKMANTQTKCVRHRNATNAEIIAT